LIHVLISLKFNAATPAVTQSPAIIVNTKICDSSTFARTAIITVSAIPKATGIQPRLPLVTNNNAPPVRMRIVPLNLSGSRACATSVIGDSAIALAKGRDSPPPCVDWQPRTNIGSKYLMNQPCPPAVRHVARLREFVSR
jgi:hypothetical protein